jgi:hypothetical protein
MKHMLRLPMLHFPVSAAWKELTAIILGLLLAGSAFSKPDTPELVLELEDGSLVIGLPEPAVFKLATQYGPLEIPLSRILGMTFDKEAQSVTLTLMDRDRVTGRLGRDTFQLSTIVGELQVPIGRVLRGMVRVDGQILNLSAWSEPVDGLRVRLLSDVKEAKLNSTFKLTLELWNDSDKDLILPFLQVAERVHRQGSAAIRWENRSIYIVAAPVNGDEEELEVGEVMEEALLEDDRLDAGKSTSFEITITLSNERVEGAMQEARKVKDLRKQMTGRTAWRNSRGTTWNLSAVVHRPLRMGRMLRMAVSKEVLYWDDEVETPKVKIKISN